jgi:hypothetical protein
MKNDQFKVACRAVAAQSAGVATVRAGLAAMEADQSLVAECAEVFGMPFAELKAGMLEYADLDEVFVFENLFA